MLYLHVGIRVNQLSYTWNAFQPLSERLKQIQTNTHSDKRSFYIIIFYIYKTFTLMEYYPFKGVLTPLLGFIK